MLEKHQNLINDATNCHYVSVFDEDQPRDIENLISTGLSFLESKVNADIFVLVPDNKPGRAYLVTKYFEPGQFKAIDISTEKNSLLFNILSENNGKTYFEKTELIMDLFGERGHYSVVTWHMSQVGDYIAVAVSAGKETSPVWDPADKFLLDTLSKSLSLDRELKKAMNEKKLQSHTLEILLEVNRIMVDNGSFESALECVLSRVNSIVGARGAGFMLYDEETKSLNLQKPAFGSYDDHLIDLCKVKMEDGGSSVKVFQSEKTYLSNNVHGDPRVNQSLERLYNVRNVISTPVKVNNKCIGVFHVINKPDGFSEEDLGIVRLLVSQLAIAIVNARMMYHIRAQEFQFMSLYELSMDFKLSKVERLVKLAAKKICSTIPVSMLAIAISDGQGKCRIAAEASLESSLVGLALPLLPAMPGVKELTEDSVDALEAEAARRGMCTQMAFLIQSKSEVFGKLWVWSDKRNTFSPQLVRFLSLVVNQLAIAMENAYLFKQKEKMAHSLQRLIDLNERLLCMVLKNDGIQAITNTVACYLNAGVVFYDQRLVKRAWAPQKNNVLKDFDPSHLLDTEGKPFRLGCSAGRSYLLRCKEYTMEVIAAPVDVGGDTLGYLFVVMEPAKHYEDYLSGIRRILPVYALELQKEKVAREVIQNVEGDFVSTLLEGNFTEEKIYRQASGLGYDLSIPRVVVVAELQSYDSQGSDIPVSYWSSFLNRINLYMKQHYPQSLAVALKEKLILLQQLCTSSQKSGGQDSMRGISQIMRKALEKLTGRKVYIGIGRVAQGINDLESSYKDALFCVKYLKQTKQKDQVVSFFRDLGLYQALADENAAGYLHSHMWELLGSLLESDKNKGTAYLKTLDCYFIAGCCIKTAAERLFCHVNTIRYRLDRVKKLSQIDIDDIKCRFDTQMSLKIAKYYYPEYFARSS